MVAVHDCPNGSNSLAGNVKGHEQAFFSCRNYWQQIGVAPFEMSEQQSSILIKYVSARAEIARGPTSDVRIPRARDSRPIESFAANVRRFAIFRQQAKASGVTLRNIQDRFS